MKSLKSKTVINKILALAPMLVVSATILFSGLVFTARATTNSYAGESQFKLISYNCGGVTTSINFGCQNNGNPITDLIFVVIRFLSAGVGFVIVLSVIIGGIQYIFSRGDPNATSKAVNRLVSAVIALLLYIFAYAILSYVIPQGFFR